MNKDELFKFKHGLKKHPLYDVWGKIKCRCLKKTDKDYSDYGGRGINVHAEWIADFKAFYDWAILNGWRKGLEIDRRNNDGDYCPENCRFVTRSVNMRNTRRNNNVTFNGQTRCLTEWAEILQVNRYSLFNRIFNLGWSVEDAFTIPIKTKTT